MDVLLPRYVGAATRRAPAAAALRTLARIAGQLGAVACCRIDSREKRLGTALALSKRPASRRRRRREGRVSDLYFAYSER